MRRESDFNRSGRPAVCVCPQVAQSVAWCRETEIAPGVMNSLCGIADVEDGDVEVPAGVSAGVSAGLGSRGPNHNVVSGDNRMIVPGVLIDRDDLGVGEQESGPGIGQQQIAAHDER